MTEQLLLEILLFWSKNLFGELILKNLWEVAHLGFVFVFVCHVIVHCWCQIWMGYDNYSIDKLMEFNMISFP